MELSTTLRTFAGSTSASSMTDRNFESPVNSSSVDLTFLSRSSRCGVKAIRRRLTPSRAWRPEQGEVGRGGRGQRASVFAAPVGRVGADALDHGAAAGATDGEVDDDAARDEVMELDAPDCGLAVRRGSAGLGARAECASGGTVSGFGVPVTCVG